LTYAGEPPAAGREAQMRRKESSVLSAAIAALRAPLGMGLWRRRC